LPLSSNSIAADSNVLLAAVTYRAASRVFRVPGLVVVTTDFMMAEVYEYAPLFAKRYKVDMAAVDDSIVKLPVVRFGEAEYRSHLEEAHRYLGHRDPDDVALAALALKLDIPIWSNDNDFRELPLPLYTTAQLLRALGI
jgi:predicted nucleic acid-binding protein